MTAYALPRSERAPLPVLAALTAGGLLLLLRAQAMTLGALRSGALLSAYAVLALLSLRAPVPAGRVGRFSTRVVTGAGVAAVLAVAYAPWQVGASVAYGASAAFLGTAAAVAEEAFFRRLMYGWLDRWWGGVAAVLLSAAAFALVHLPLYGTSVLWVDLGAGLLLSWQRWASGSWAPSAATHVVANLLAVSR